MPELPDGCLFLWPVQGPITSEFGYRFIFGENNFHRGLDIAAAAGTASEACATCAEGADCVVFLARILVFEHVVGLGDVLELLLAFLRLVDVRMVLAGEFAVRLRDLFLVGVLGDTQGLIEILVQPIILSHAAVPPFEAKVWVVFVKKSVWKYPCMKNGREP